MRQACDWNRPVTLLQADARKLPLPDESVQCIVTSPPYWGLRKYAGEQESVWGGFPKIDFGSLAKIPCDHEWSESVSKGISGGLHGVKADYEANRFVPEHSHGTCIRCGAWKGSYGLEPTIEMYLDHTREILRELWRVLRKDGVLFWNIGDSYAAGKIGRADSERNNVDGFTGSQKQRKATDNLKPKDLCLIPERVALAAQGDGWWVRSRILWCKPNPMPESVTDRPTDAAEHIWMLTKSERYYWDADAVREPAVTSDMRRPYGSEGMWEMDGRAEEQKHGGELRNGYKPGHDARDGKERFCSGTGGFVPPGGRNLRNVWNFPIQPYPEAHFATFPEELPRRCILAATSAKGACAQCGAPWERVTRRTVEFESGSGRAGNPPIGKNGGDYDQGVSGGYDIRMGPVIDSQTIGWTPTCRCRGQHGRTQPCVVLDPFGGSGTIGRVAIELRRRAVLCDIAYGEKDVYRALAEDRTSEVDVRLPFL